ncbi:MAG: NADP-dependent oxidoreductase [Chloroflexi bacterium]|nr:NADP-dependent oxidoreductase [Chloroflexota bacterium]
MVKAAQIGRYGGVEVVEITDGAPKPALAAGRVLIEVYVAGVNPVDWKIREGYLKQMLPLQFPATLGGDFSGVVAGVLDGAAGFKEGDEAYGQASVLSGGSFAEFTTADIKATARKPASIGHVEAAALPLVGASAWQAIVEHIGLSRGQRVLIHGGAGGIGTMAIQLAKHLGAYVATTATTGDKPYVKGLGADEVIDYEKYSFEDLLRDFDAVFDTVGGETYGRSFKVLKRGGIIVSMLEQPRPDLMQQYGVRAVGQYTQVTNDRLSKLAELVDRGVIRVHIDRTFRLDEAAKALDYVRYGRPRGKVVLKVKKE